MWRNFKDNYLTSSGFVGKDDNNDDDLDMEKKLKELI